MAKNKKSRGSDLRAIRRMKRSAGKVGGLLRPGRARRAKMAYGYSNYDDRVPWMDDRTRQDGTFVGRDRSRWRYFSTPKGVRVDMTADPDEAVENQIGFVDLFVKLAEELDRGQSLTDPNKSETRGFHIQGTRRLSDGIEPAAGSTAAQIDYLKRVSKEGPSFSWDLHMGLRLSALNVNTGAYSVAEQKERIARIIENADSERAYVLAQDSALVQQRMEAAGFGSLDFNEDYESWAKITSWFCNTEKGQTARNAVMAWPLYGNSVILPRYGEVTFYSVRPKTENSLYFDPSDFAAKYAREFYNRKNRVVHFSLRGEIMSMKHTREELAIRDDDLGRRTFKEDTPRSTQEEVMDQQDDVTLARRIGRNMPLIKDFALLLAVQSVPGEVNPIIAALENDYKLTAEPVVGNHDEALHFTMPGYNKPLFSSGMGLFSQWRKSDALSQVFPGAALVSGIFNSAFPPTSKGVYVGHMESFHEHKPVMIDPTSSASQDGGNSPGILVTGRPSSGKALPLDTPLRRYDGSIVTMGEVKEGDSLIDHRGNEARVTYKTPIMHHETCMVSLSDGRTHECDWDHLWLVEAPAIRRAVNSLRAAPPPFGDVYEHARRFGGDVLWPTREAFRDSMRLLDKPSAAWEDVQERLGQMIQSVGGDSRVRLSAREIRSMMTANYQTLFEVIPTQPIEFRGSEGAGEVEELLRKPVNERSLYLARLLTKCRPTGPLDNGNAGPSMDFWPDELSAEDFSLLARSVGWSPTINDDGSVAVSLDEAAYVYSIEGTGNAKDVQCISVDSPMRTYLLGDLTVTSNTTTMQQMARQGHNNRSFVAYFNFKTTSSQAEFWREMGGVVISLDGRMLGSNPGCLDPFIFHQQRPSVADTLAGAVGTLWDRAVSKAPVSKGITTSSVRSTITNNVRDSRVMCSGEAIFGKGEAEKMQEWFDLEERLLEETSSRNREWQPIEDALYAKAKELGIVPPIPYRDVRREVRNAIGNDPFWKALIAPDPSSSRHILRDVNDGRPILFEWGKTLDLPSKDIPVESHTDAQTASLASVLTALRYTDEAAQAHSNRHGRGGFIFLDEFAKAQSSTEIMSLWEKIQREYREVGIRIVTSSQYLVEWESRLKFFSTFIIGAMPSRSQEELDAFIRLIGAEKSREEKIEFITNAGRTREHEPGSDRASRSQVHNTIPFAWFMDEFQDDLSGPMMLGPYPIKELTLGRTDKDAKRIREEMRLESEMGYTGVGESDLLQASQALDRAMYE